MVGPSRAWAPEPARTRWRWRESVAGMECAASVAARARRASGPRRCSVGTDPGAGLGGRRVKTSTVIHAHQRATKAYRLKHSGNHPRNGAARKDAAGTPAS